ncbi:hypothetical protein BJX63DRAFT_428062 [Aspergillus granulosus]|uniref:Thioredoxin domain-containing protein n=1 Tax=Aspergillus granulosus TaxID=176169 RepID=A0ABR4HZ23_9EURO
MDDKILKKATRLRKVVLIDPWSFFPYEWCAPCSVKEAMDPGVCRKPTELDIDPSLTSNTYIGPLNEILAFNWCISGQPNYYRDGNYPTPEYYLQFFEYMFRRYLGMRFSDSAFEENPHFQPY